MSMKLKLTDHLLARCQDLRNQHHDNEALAVLDRLACFHGLPAETAEMAQASLGEMLVQRKKWTPARRHLTAALLYRPDCARYHYLMALALAHGRNSDPDRAREHFDKALELDSELAECHADFGLFCLKQGDAEEGIEALRRAVDLAPENPTLLDRLVQALEQIGQGDEARKLLAQARFRRDDRFTKLWNDFRFREARAAQQAEQRQTQKRRTNERVILPFVRPVAEKRSLVRHDGPATLPAPHTPLRPVRRSQQG